MPRGLGRGSGRPSRSLPRDLTVDSPPVLFNYALGNLVSKRPPPDRRPPCRWARILLLIKLGAPMRTAIYLSRLIDLIPGIRPEGIMISDERKGNGSSRGRVSSPLTCRIMQSVPPCFPPRKSSPSRSSPPPSSPPPTKSSPSRKPPTTCSPSPPPPPSTGTRSNRSSATTWAPTSP